MVIEVPLYWAVLVAVYDKQLILFFIYKYPARADVLQSISLVSLGMLYNLTIEFV